MNLISLLFLTHLIMELRNCYCIEEVCNIKKLKLDGSMINLNLEQLIEPVIFVDDPGRNARIRRLGTRKYLLEHYGSNNVTLSSSNTYSYSKVRMSLFSYLTKKSEQCIDKVNSNETYYFFGNNYGNIWDEISSQYVYPPCKHCKIAGAVTIGLGQADSGVSFHFHGPGFSEVVIGSKQWLLFPPFTETLSLNIQPNMTVTQWLTEVYPTLSTDITSKMMICTIKQGEMLYFPDKWLHGTINLDDYNFFISLFVDMRLMQRAQQAVLGET